LYRLYLRGFCCKILNHSRQRITPRAKSVLFFGSLSTDGSKITRFSGRCASLSEHTLLFGFQAGTLLTEGCIPLFPLKRLLYGLWITALLTYLIGNLGQLCVNACLGRKVEKG
jgi:hypothetical protein